MPNVKKFKLISIANHLGFPDGEFKSIHNVINELVGNLKYPIKAIDTGTVGDTKLPTVALPNGNKVNLYYFEYETIE